MRSTSTSVRAAIVALLAVATVAIQARAASFVALAGDGYRATDVSADGSVVTGFRQDATVTPRVWRNEVPEPVPTLPGGGFFTTADAVSADGSVVVGGSGEISEAYRYEDGTTTGLGFLPGAPVSSASGANGVSADGAVIVGYSEGPNGLEAFRYEGGVMVGLGDLSGGSFQSVALDVSGDGSVVVGSSISALGTEAFRWSNGTMEGLGDLPGGAFGSVAHAVSADGSVVVGRANGGSNAFRWKDGVMTDLGTLGGPGSTRALDVSGDGAIVVGRSGGVAFVWDENNGMRLLADVLVNDFGLDLGFFTSLLEATAISPDGRTIVGYGEYQTHPLEPVELRSFIAVIPEPASAALVGLGLLGLAACRRRAAV